MRWAKVAPPRRKLCPENSEGFTPILPRQNRNVSTKSRCVRGGIPPSRVGTAKARPVRGVSMWADPEGIHQGPHCGSRRWLGIRRVHRTVRCTRAWNWFVLEWRKVKVTSDWPNTTSPRQRCRRELKASALSTVKLSFRRKQKKAMSMAPHTTTMTGVDQSMAGHSLMRMSSAGVIGSLRFTGVRHRHL
jgi:hypothetical protein